MAADGVNAGVGRAVAVFHLGEVFGHGLSPVLSILALLVCGGLCLPQALGVPYSANVLRAGLRLALPLYFAA